MREPRQPLASSAEEASAELGATGETPPDARVTPRAYPVKRKAQAETSAPLDPRLRPFAHALADLLLADLLKYPPEKP